MLRRVAERQIDPTHGVGHAKKILAVMLAASVVQLACAAGMWMWKQWGVFGYVGLALLQLFISARGSAQHETSYSHVLWIALVLVAALPKWSQFDGTWISRRFRVRVVARTFSSGRCRTVVLRGIPWLVALWWVGSLAWQLVVPAPLGPDRDLGEVREPFTWNVVHYLDVGVAVHCDGDPELRRYEVDAALRSDEELLLRGDEPEGVGPARRRYVRPEPRPEVPAGRTLLVAPTADPFGEGPRRSRPSW